jgi:hypothetical protein
MIELESPNERAFTKAGLPGKKLAEALKQVRDWRTWLTDNVAYARNELGLKDIDASCPSYVVIGRRGSLDASQAKTYGALSCGVDRRISLDEILITCLTRPVRPKALTRPEVTVCPRPNGLPTAIAKSPTSSASLFPSAIALRPFGSLTCRSATSVCASTGSVMMDGRE